MDPTPGSAAQLLMTSFATYPGASTSRNGSTSTQQDDPVVQGAYGNQQVIPSDFGDDMGHMPPNYFSNLLEEAIGESPVPENPSPIHDHAVFAEPTTTGSAAVVPETTSASHGDGSEDDEANSQPNAPYIGMRFDTLEEAREHYNLYALVKGFSIKNNTNRRSGYTGEIEKQQFACNCFRKPDEDPGGVEKAVAVSHIPVTPPPLDEVEKEAAEIASVIAELDAQGSKGKKKKKKKRQRERIKKTYCKAKMTVKQMDGRWQVIGFVEQHNHPCVSKPSLSKYLRSHQGMKQEERDFVRNLWNTNLGAGQMMHIMSEFYGTEALVPYTAKTITNECAKFRSEIKEGDAEQVINYFREKQQEDPDFFYRVKMDAEDRVENVFWVDGAARRAYAEAYHDCVSFDTTYLTNMYNMPFAPFIGINRHGQSIMMGCAFVRQELATSYDWVFQAFLDAMGGRQPDNIIIDQDVAMEVSIARIFPLSVHRNCRWHIMQTAQKEVGPTCGRNPEMSDDFNEVVNFSFSGEEFEAKWALFMGKWPAAAAHPHFHVLYKIRARWVPCYFKHRFFPFLQSTQRSEGFNAVLKRYVNPHKSLMNFVKQYEKIQLHVLVKEGGNDCSTDFLECDTWSDFPIELQAYKVYTRGIYRRFKIEFELIGRYNVRPFGSNYYRLEPNRQFVGKYGSRVYLVTANPAEGTYSCECAKMERDGMLCCHVLKVFTHLGVDVIPDRYILKRWTQYAVSSHAPPTEEQYQPDVMPPESQQQVRHANLNMNFSKVATVASKTDEAAAILNRHIRAAATEIAQLNKSRKRKRTAEAGPSNSAPTQRTPGERTVPRDPPKSTTKGRTKAHRVLNALELQPKKKNKCSMCGSEEHTAARCSTKLM